jgi:hypothetical protein
VHPGNERIGGDGIDATPDTVSFDDLTFEQLFLLRGVLENPDKGAAVLAHKARCRSIELESLANVGLVDVAGPERWLVTDRGRAVLKQAHDAGVLDGDL